MMNQLVLGRRCIMFLNLALVSALLLPSLLIAHQEEVEEEEGCLSNQWAVRLRPGGSPATASVVAARNGLLLQGLGANSFH